MIWIFRIVGVDYPLSKNKAYFDHYPTIADLDMIKNHGTPITDEEMVYLLRQGYVYSSHSQSREMYKIMKTMLNKVIT